MTKGQVAKLKIEYKRKWLTCTTCSNEVQVDDDVIAVKCATCTCKMIPLERRLTQMKQKSDKPAGWRFMAEFVDRDGNVYHFGEEQLKLKGTKEPSDVDKIREEQKKKRKETKTKKELRAQMKEARMIKMHEKKMKAKKKKEAEKHAELDRKLGKKTETVLVKKLKRQRKPGSKKAKKK